MDLTKYQLLSVNIVSALIFTAINILLLSKLRITTKKVCYKTNGPFRLLWLILLLFTTLNSVYEYIGLFVTLLNVLPLKIVQSTLEHLWAFTYSIVLTQITILLKVTILNTQRAFTEPHLKYQWLNLAPLGMYLFTVPYKSMFFLLDSDSNTLKVLSFLCKFIIFLNSLYTFGVIVKLTKNFKELIGIIKQNPFSRKKNEKRMREWRIFIMAVLTTGYIYLLVSAGFVVKSFFESVASKKQTGEYNLSIKSIIIIVTKVYSSIILVFLSPYTMVKKEETRSQIAN